MLHGTNITAVGEAVKRGGTAASAYVWIIAVRPGIVTPCSGQLEFMWE